MITVNPETEAVKKEGVVEVTITDSSSNIGKYLVLGVLLLGALCASTFLFLGPATPSIQPVHNDHSSVKDVQVGEATVKHEHSHASCRSHSDTHHDKEDMVEQEELNEEVVEEVKPVGLVAKVKGIPARVSVHVARLSRGSKAVLAASVLTAVVAIAAGMYGYATRLVVQPLNDIVIVDPIINAKPDESIIAMMLEQWGVFVSVVGLGWAWGITYAVSFIILYTLFRIVRRLIFRRPHGERDRRERGIFKTCGKKLGKCLSCFSCRRSERPDGEPSMMERTGKKGGASWISSITSLLPSFSRCRKNRGNMTGLHDTETNLYFDKPSKFPTEEKKSCFSAISSCFGWFSPRDVGEGPTATTRLPATKKPSFMTNLTTCFGILGGGRARPLKEFPTES